MTNIEENVEKVLDKIGFFIKDFKDRSIYDCVNTFYKQVPIGTYRVDFAFFHAKIIIEVHGQYWHASNQQSVTAFQFMNRLRDSRKKSDLSDWSIIEVTESSLNNKYSFEIYLKNKILSTYKII